MKPTVRTAQRRSRCECSFAQFDRCRATGASLVTAQRSPGDDPALLHHERSPARPSRPGLPAPHPEPGGAGRTSVPTSGSSSSRSRWGRAAPTSVAAALASTSSSSSSACCSRAAARHGTLANGASTGSALSLRLPLVLPAPAHPAGGERARARRADPRVRSARLRRRAEPRVGPLRHAATTEWFAFFYFGYFFLLASRVPDDARARRQRAPRAFLVRASSSSSAPATSSTCSCRATARTTSSRAVPPRAPRRHVLGAREGSGRRGGAQKDIFPSLHTAAPTFFALFSFRHRSAAVQVHVADRAFCATQIICATMFLRWHYLIDIFAGLTLATFGTCSCPVG